MGVYVDSIGICNASSFFGCSLAPNVTALTVLDRDYLV